MSVVLFAVIAILSSSISKAQCTYCTTSSTNLYDCIGQVIFGDINNYTGSSLSDDYSDFTNKSTNVIAGNNYTITVYNGTTYNADAVTVFIDWNQDCDLEDANERYNLLTDAWAAACWA